MLTIWIDDFFCLTWFYRWLRFKKERALTMVLREYGDLSMQQRACVEAWRKADFSVRYGRSAPNELRNFVRAAAAAIPHDDLRLLVVNRDLRIKGEVVTVRCGWEMQLLSWVTSATFACHVIFLSVLTLLKNGPWLTTFGVLVGVFSIYGFLWRGMSLYTNRPLTAARRHTTELFDIAKQLKGAEIRHL